MLSWHVINRLKTESPSAFHVVGHLGKIFSNVLLFSPRLSRKYTKWYQQSVCWQVCEHMCACSVSISFHPPVHLVSLKLSDDTCTDITWAPKIDVCVCVCNSWNIEHPCAISPGWEQYRTPFSPQLHFGVLQSSFSPAFCCKMQLENWSMLLTWQHSTGNTEI